MHVPWREIKAQNELKTNYELYNGFVDAVKTTFENTEYDYIYIRDNGSIDAHKKDNDSAYLNKDGSIDAYNSSNEITVIQITEFDELNKIYHNLYTDRLYNVLYSVVIQFNSERRIAMIIPYNLVEISSEQFIAYYMIYKEEGFVCERPMGIAKNRDEMRIESANLVPGEIEWYFWNEKSTMVKYV